MVDAVEVKTNHTYLPATNTSAIFEPGDDHTYGAVENGYPKYIDIPCSTRSRALKNLARILAGGIDAALPTTARFISVKAIRYVVSETLYKTYTHNAFAGPLCALLEHGSLFLKMLTVGSTTARRRAIVHGGRRDETGSDAAVEPKACPLTIAAGWMPCSRAWTSIPISSKMTTVLISATAESLSAGGRVDDRWPISMTTTGLMLRLSDATAKPTS
ncbi:MAG: hypothetical protein R3E79_53045 [Caldilineaceae bacterium]